MNGPGLLGGDMTLTRWGQFQCDEMEERFRLYHRRQEVQLSAVCFIAAILGMLLYIPNDLNIMGVTSAFWLLLSVRLSFAAYAAAALVILPRVGTQGMNRLLMAWAVIGTAAALGVGWTRPSIYFYGFLIAQTFAGLLVFFVAPLSVEWQSSIMVFGTAVNWYLLFARHPETPPVVWRAICVSHVALIIVGTGVSWNLHRLKRQQFAALRRESALRKDLESTFAEVKTLRGIVPICAHCKSVRTDQGYWQQVDVYVREHTEAEFTHGICPQCLAQHYGREFRESAGA